MDPVDKKQCGHSTDLFTWFSNFTKVARVVGKNCSELFKSEVQTLKYEDFLKILQEANMRSTTFGDTNSRIIFAIKRGTDSTIFWKATVQIAAVNIETENGKTKILNYRLLNLTEFINIFHTIQSHSALTSELNEERTIFKRQGHNNFCCICFERRDEIILPCAHGFCTQCIEEWNEKNNTCPICREKVQDVNDHWILPEIPEVSEVYKEMQTSLTSLIQEKRTE